MDRKYLIVTLMIILTIGFVCAKSGDIDVSSDGIAHISFPEDNQDYDYLISNFSWNLISGSGITFHNCFYKLNSVMYSIFNCSTFEVNFSSVLSDNIYNLVLFANITDSGGDNYEEYWMANSRFTIDTLPPQITITYPIAQTYDHMINHINYSLNEPNPSSCWFSNGITTIYSIPCIHGNNTFYFNSSENQNTWTIFANDTHTRENNSSVIFTTDTIPPLIDFGISTTPEGNQSQDHIFVIVTATDNNLKTFELNLYRDSTLIPPSPILPSGGFTISYNFTSLSDGNYTLIASATDNVGHSNQSTRNIVLDSNPPIINVISSPNNNQPLELSENNVNISFTVSDYSEIPSCSLFINGQINQTIPNPSKGPTHILQLNNLVFGGYSWYISCQEDFEPHNKITNTSVQSFTILSNVTFPADTNHTDLPSQPDISNVDFYVANPNGMINWTNPLDLSRGLNWANYIFLNANSANVDASFASELNQPAIITLRNLSWTNPEVLRDGGVCSDCPILDYTNGTLMFSVTGFSEYTTREYVAGFSGSSGGGGSRCKTNWTCSEWSECIFGWQNRTCVKTKVSCRSKVEMPAEIQPCIVPYVPEPVIEEKPEPEITMQEEIEDMEKESWWGITGAAISSISISPETLRGIGVAIGFVAIVLLIFTAWRTVRLKQDQKIKRFILEVKQNHRLKRKKSFV